MNGLKNPRPAVFAAAALASLFVAAPALADKKDKGEVPQAESHARNHIKDDKTGKSDAPAAPAAGSACPERAFSTVFSAFRDRALYTLAPDGDFEAGAVGWSLTDGAAVVDESSSIQLGAVLGATSLELAAGASAVSPEICVERGFPSFRFAARGAGVLRVHVIYRGGRRSKKAGRVKGGKAWHVTRKVSLAQGRFRVKRGQSANVQLKFTASRGTIRMDDLYVDPRLRR